MVKGDAAAAFLEKFAGGRLKVGCRKEKGLGEIRSSARGASRRLIKLFIGTLRPYFNDKSRIASGSRK